MSKLTDSQARLDELEKKIIANKEARKVPEKLKEEGRRLRDAYLAEQKVREALLKEELRGGNK